MNRVSGILIVVLSLLISFPLAPVGGGQGKKNASGEEFFIVSAVDQSKSQLLLKRPTEITVLMQVNERSVFLDEAGKNLKLADFRAGDTLWVTSTADAGGKHVAVRIRKGPMTMQELHKLYLDSMTTLGPSSR
jgi:hypothetical protein